MSGKSLSHRQREGRKTMKTKDRTVPRWLPAAIALAGGSALAVWAAGRLGITSLEGAVLLIRSAAPWSCLSFLLLQLSSVVLAPIPSNLMATVGGACFGFPLGFAMTFCSVTAGSLLTFSLSRWLGRGWARRMVEEKVSDKYLSLLERKRDSFLVLVFLFPFFPDDLICILAGLTDIPFRRFGLIVLLTRHWGLMAASLAGANLFTAPGWMLPVLASAGAVLFLLGLRYGDAVEEALCFGWIDSTVKAGEGVMWRRFSPRRKRSPWTELNKERCRRLERLGLMTDAGRAVLPNMDFHIDDDVLVALQGDEAVWQNFQTGGR
jgi:uncharacterized membrane protein YdjX (TVP38/TMEM64 family)